MRTRLLRLADRSRRYPNQAIRWSSSSGTSTSRRSAPRRGRARPRRPSERRASALRSRHDVEILALGAMNSLSDERIEYMILDRLGRLRFLGFRLGETMPGEKTIRLFRGKPAKAGAFEKFFQDCDKQLRAKGCEPRKGQMADAAAVSAPRQRMTDEEKAGAKKGESASRIRDKPEKARRKAADARWTMKRLKVRKVDRDGKSGEGGGGFPCEKERGCKNHVAVDKKWRRVRCWSATDAARHDGHELESILDMDNSCKTVRADSAYLSAKNEAMPNRKGSSRGSIARSPRASRCPGTFAARTRSGRRSGPASSTCSPTGKGRWNSRSAASGWPAPRGESGWPTFAATCVAWFPWSEGWLQDESVGNLEIAPHSPGIGPRGTENRADRRRFFKKSGFEAETAQCTFNFSR